MVRPFGLVIGLSAVVALQPWAAALAAGFPAVQPAEPGAPLLAQVPQSQRVDPAALLQLKVRRLPDAIELIIEGTGPAPQLQQSSSGTSWQGQLFTAVPAALRVGPQRLSLPEVGLQAVSFEGVGQSFTLTVTPVQGINLGRPVVSADGRDLIVTFASPVPQASLQTIRPNLAQPGAIPLPSFAPPLQPRAVAPPLGDMAVGTMTARHPGSLNLSGPQVTMTFNKAPVREALLMLARAGGYGFAYIPESLTEEGKDYRGMESLKIQSQRSSADGLNASTDSSFEIRENPRPITVSFQSESFSTAMNAVLAAGGLQARLQGRTIFAGPNMLALSSYAPQLSRVYRLNQATAESAAQYLASLGASISVPQVVSITESTGSTTATGGGSTVGGTTSSRTNTLSSQITEIQTFGGKNGLLLGLIGTTDSRLGTITLVGEPAIVAVAEGYLKQIDLRQRQVALNVRILDVNLDNVSEIDNSFALRWGDNFIVNDRGQLIGAFGRALPPETSAFRRDVPREITFEDGKFTVEGGAGGLGLTAESSILTVQTRRGREIDSSVLRQLKRQTNAQLVPSVNPNTGRVSYTVIPQQGTSVRSVTRTIERLLGNEVSIQRGTAEGTVSGVVQNPVNNYSDTFFDFVRAQIVSGSTKLLASPTLILQDNSSLLREGSEAAAALSNQQVAQGISNIGLDGAIGRRRANEGVVRVGTNVVTGYETETPSQGGNVVCTPQLSTAGLVLGARVEKIDDNGFITFTLSPSVSAITGQEAAPQGCGSNLNILSVRSLDTGALRVRDGQTLIMTGVISEFDRQQVSKWPILGDIPLIGQFFRASSGRKEKRELVIMVTPRIVNDEQGGVYGYGYQPGTSAGRDFFGAAMQGSGLN